MGELTEIEKQNIDLLKRYSSMQRPTRIPLVDEIELRKIRAIGLPFHFSEEVHFSY